MLNSIAQMDTPVHAPTFYILKETTNFVKQIPLYYLLHFTEPEGSLSFSQKPSICLSYKT